MVGQSRRRFVEDEDAGALSERLHDLDELAPADPEGPHRGPDVDVDAEAGKEALGLEVHSVGVDERPAARLVAEKDVLRDGHVVDQRELLVDHRDASRLCVPHRLEAGGGAVDEERAFVRIGRIETAEDLDEGRLPGPVLAAKGVNLGRSQVEAHAVERDDAAEAFDDPVRPNDGHGAARGGPR